MHLTKDERDLLDTLGRENSAPFSRLTYRGIRTAVSLERKSLVVIHRPPVGEGRWMVALVEGEL